MSLQLHLFLGSKEILFLQLAKETTLSLQSDRFKYRLLMLHFGGQTFFFPGNKQNKNRTHFCTGCRDTRITQALQLPQSNSTAQLHSFISTIAVLCVCGCEEVQHLELSLRRSTDDHFPQFGICSFCGGDLKESRQPAFYNLYLYFQFPSVR